MDYSTKVISLLLILLAWVWVILFIEIKKNQETTIYNTTIESLNAIILSKNREIETLSSKIVPLWTEISSQSKENNTELENLKIAKFSCLFDDICRDTYSKWLRIKYLNSKNKMDAVYQYASSGQNFYKYFLDPQKDFPLEMQTIIKSNCPSYIYDTPGKLFTRHQYSMNNDEISIITDQESFNIICSWIYNKATLQYWSL